MAATRRNLPVLIFCIVIGVSILQLEVCFEVRKLIGKDTSNFTVKVLRVNGTNEGTTHADEQLGLSLFRIQENASKSDKDGYEELVIRAARLCSPDSLFQAYRKALHSWADNDNDAGDVVLTTDALSKSGLPMNYGDVMMEMAMLSMFDGRVRLLRRNEQNISEFCNQKARYTKGKLFIDLPGLIYGPSNSQVTKIHLTRRAAVCAREAGFVNIVAPQSFYPIGPDLSDARHEFSDMLHTFQYVFARDPETRAELVGIAIDEVSTDSPGRQAIYAEAIRLAPDVAFHHEPRCAAGVGELWSHNSKTRKSPAITRVGINFNRRVLETYGDDYMNSFDFVLRLLVDRFGPDSVLLIPHERGRRGRKEKCDQHWSLHFAKKYGVGSLALSHKMRTKLDEDVDLDLAYARLLDATIADLDLFVSSRFHALVVALAHGVPSLTFSWSSKYERLLGMVLSSTHHSYIDMLLLQPGKDTNEEMRNKVDWVVRELVDLRTALMVDAKKTKSDLTTKFWNLLQSLRPSSVRINKR